MFYSCIDVNFSKILYFRFDKNLFIADIYYVNERRIHIISNIISIILQITRKCNKNYLCNEINIFT